MFDKHLSNVSSLGKKKKKFSVEKLLLFPLPVYTYFTFIFFFLFSFFYFFLLYLNFFASFFFFSCLSFYHPFPSLTFIPFFISSFSPNPFCCIIHIFPLTFPRLTCCSVFFSHYFLTPPPLLLISPIFKLFLILKILLSLFLYSSILTFFRSFNQSICF